MAVFVLATSLLLGALVPPAEASKKVRMLAEKRAEPDAPTRAPAAAVVPVFARNLHTLDIMPLQRAEPDGGLRLLGDHHYSTFLRCWFTEEAGPIPGVLVARIVEAALHFDRKRVHVISGFRHPKYNLMLRKKGREVASQSQHTEAKAVDFAVVGVATERLYEWVRGHHVGGVGLYPYSGFVHVDLGPNRTWKGR